MYHGTAPPAALGLVAGLLASTATVTVSATGLLPVWVTTLLLFFAGGLAAGLAASVRPTTGALLGAATGIFAAVLQAVVALAQWTHVPDPYITPPPFVLIALATAFFYVPVYAVEGAAGAFLRPRLRAGRGTHRHPARRSAGHPRCGNGRGSLRGRSSSPSPSPSRS